MSKSLKILSTTLLVGAVLFLAVGCNWGKKDTATNDESATALPTADAIGEDMADVSRYPDSVRTYYLKDSEEVDIIYVSSDTAEKVRDYYRDLLVQKGWKLTAEATDYLDFEKGDTNNPEMFSVYFEWKKKKAQTEYELIYTPPLTVEELKEFESEE